MADKGKIRGRGKYKTEYLENEKSFLDKKKSIFHLIIYRISFGEKKEK